MQLQWINKADKDPLKEIHYGGIVVYHNKLKKLVHCTPRYTYFEESSKGIEDPPLAGVKTDLYYTSYEENRVKDFDLWAEFNIQDYINDLVHKPFDILYDLKVNSKSYIKYMPSELIDTIVDQL